MKRLMIVSAGAAALVSSAAAAQALPSDQPPGPHLQALATPDLLEKLGQAGEFELDEGRLAARRSPLPQVRRLAARIVRDDAERGRTIRNAAHQAGLPAPGQAGLDLGQQQMFEMLKVTPASTFDDLYIDQQVRGERRALALLAGYISQNEAGPVRKAALRLRTMAKDHIAVLRRMQGRRG